MPARYLASLIVLLVCGLPLGWVMYTLATHVYLLTDLSLTSFRISLLIRTLAYNAMAAGLACAMGLPMAVVLGRGRGTLNCLLWVIVPAALFMPSIAFTYGWAEFFRAVRLSPMPASGWDVARCVWTLAAWLWAVPACMVGLALRRMDTTLQQHALLDGALWRVTGRQLLAPLLVAFAVTMILATQEFAVFEPTGISVVATELRLVFDTGAFSSLPYTTSSTGLTPDQKARAAAALVTAAPLLTIILLLAGYTLWLANHTAIADPTDAPTQTLPKSLRPSRLQSTLAFLILLLTLVLPITTLFLQLKRPLSLPRLWAEFSPPTLGSITLSTLTATLALFLACAFTLERRGQERPSLPKTHRLATRLAGGETGLVLAVLCFLLGGQVVAISLLRSFAAVWTAMDRFVGVGDGAVLPVMAYLARFGFIAILAGLATRTRAWREVRDLAALDGASPLRTTVSVIVPLAWPWLVASALLVAALSLTEVPATVLLSPQRPQPLTPFLMTWVHMSRYDPMLEASLLMMALTLTPALLAAALLGLRSSRPTLLPNDAVDTEPPSQATRDG